LDRNANPIPGAKIVISESENAKEITSTFTDELGVYRVSSDLFDIDKTYDVAITIPEIADITNGGIMSKEIAVSKSDLYQVDFFFDQQLSPYEIALGDELRIVSAKAYHHPFKHELAIKWAVNNPSNQASFEIIRNLDVLARDFKSSRENLFIDRNGYPNSNPRYLLKAFDKNSDGERIFQDEIFIDVEIPGLSKPLFLSAAPSEKQGVINLRWTREDTYAEAFVVSRLGGISVLGDVAKDEPLAFTDKQGSPQDNYNYSVNGYVSINGEPKSGPAINSANIQYPKPPSVNNLAASETSDGYSIDLTWDYPETDISLDGVEIYREEDLIATVDYPDASFTDEEGVPNTVTTYIVNTFRRLADEELSTESISRSKDTVTTILYPTVKPVFEEDIQISALSSDTLQVAWEYDRLVDEFEITIERRLASEVDYETVDVIQVPYVEENNDQYKLSLFDYVGKDVLRITIQVNRTVDQVKYQSDPTILEGVTFPEFDVLSNFTATSTGGPAYFVHWEYPSFNFDEFILQVNGLEYGRYHPGTRSVFYPLPVSFLGQNVQPTFTLIVKRTIRGEEVRQTFPMDNAQIDQIDLTNSAFLGSQIDASNGALDDVRITWNIDPGTDNGVMNYEVYRTLYNPTTQKMDSLSTVASIAKVSDGRYEVYDYQAQPGLTYLYQVIGYDSDDQERRTIVKRLFSDTGFSPAKASVTISAIAEKGGAPVDGLDFIVRAEIRQGDLLENFVYEKITTGADDEQGLITAFELPFKNAQGDKLTYEIASTEPKEDYLWDFSGDFKFNAPNQQKILNLFNYRKLNSINGSINYTTCSTCGVDSVEVTLEVYTSSRKIDGEYIGSKLIEESKLSDQNGNFSFSVPSAFLDRKSIDIQSDRREVR
ncbi:MAG: hypothetical protein AAFY41_04775, partial [Bacteroidota bacterium]